MEFDRAQLPPGPLAVSYEGAVATLTLNRPEKRNALSIDLRRELAAALRFTAEDDGVRAVVVAGAGAAFCAGMDVMQFGGDAEHRLALVESTEAMIDALDEHPRPIVAAIGGPALGGGFVLALLCDLRIAGPRATFGFPEVVRGIPASYAAARAVLPRGTAAELCLTGRIVDARAALAMGVVGELAEDPDTAAHARAQQIAALPPGGLARTKAWMSQDGAWRALLAEERRAFRAALLRGPKGKE